jgi:glycosyltransferase involved in cell wall biosynthesis
MEKPLVSVCLITYNHARFINEAIDSVLMQKLSFPWELIIADDFSTDGTREIVRDYKTRYPDNIKLILQERNVGPARNWLDLMAAPDGKYIAYFEGDDYWTDSKKLQQQVEFLEAHPEFVGCFHNAEERYIDDELKASFLYCNYSEARIVSFADLSYCNLIPTCSALFRSNLFGEIPDWFLGLKMGDWPLHLLNAQFGDFWYMPVIMCVHRLHKNSLWMLQDAKLNRQFTIDAYDVMIREYTEKPNLQKQLIIAKEAFIVSAAREDSKPGFKQRLKGLARRMIQKI